MVPCTKYCVIAKDILFGRSMTCKILYHFGMLDIYQRIYIIIYIYHIYLHTHTNIHVFIRCVCIHRYNLPTTKRINYIFTSPSIRETSNPCEISRQSYRSANDTSACHGSLPRRLPSLKRTNVWICPWKVVMVGRYWKMTFPFGSGLFSGTNCCTVVLGSVFNCSFVH